MALRGMARRGAAPCGMGGMRDVARHGTRSHASWHAARCEARDGSHAGRHVARNHHAARHRLTLRGMSGRARARGARTRRARTRRARARGTWPNMRDMDTPSSPLGSQEPRKPRSDFPIGANRGTEVSISAVSGRFPPARVHIGRFCPISPGARPWRPNLPSFAARMSNIGALDTTEERSAPTRYHGSIRNPH